MRALLGGTGDLQYPPPRAPSGHPPNWPSALPPGSWHLLHRNPAPPRSPICTVPPHTQPRPNVHGAGAGAAAALARVL